MPKFIYRAKKDPQNIIEDTIIADNKSAAIQKISNMGYYLLSVDECADSADAGKGINIFQKKARLKDVTNFTRQLSDLLDSGLTVVKALDILYKQTDNKRLKDAISDARNFCIDGNSLSSALSRHPDVFSNLFVSMVMSGEAGGALGGILRRLADFNDRQLEIQVKVKTALAYPILMSVVGCITIIILLTFVIPKMMAMFSDLGQNLPLPTLILIRINELIRNYWWLIIAVITAIIFAFGRMHKTREGKYSIDKFKLRMPVFGNLIKKIEIARFSRTLATLLNNGVPILESLRIVAETVGNEVIREEIKKSETAVRDGSSVARSFSGSSVIPDLVVNMIAVGEEGGQVEKTLYKVAEGYERETDAAIKVMMSLLEPALILVLGLIVGFIVISMLLPIFEINFLVR